MLPAVDWHYSDSEEYELMGGGDVCLNRCHGNVRKMTVTDVDTPWLDYLQIVSNHSRQPLLKLRKTISLLDTADQQ